MQIVASRLYEGIVEGALEPGQRRPPRFERPLGALGEDRHDPKPRGFQAISRARGKAWEPIPQRTTATLLNRNRSERHMASAHSMLPHIIRLVAVGVNWQEI